MRLSVRSVGGLTLILLGFAVAFETMIYFDEERSATHGMQARTLLEKAVGRERESWLFRLCELLGGIALVAGGAVVIVREKQP